MSNTSSATPATPFESHEESPALLIPEEVARNRGVIALLPALSSFFLALLQSICGAVLAINGLRLAIGLGALAMSTGAGAAMIRFHADAIRVPMIAAALAGSFLNLAILLHLRRLRKRPASQWRQRPLSARQKRMEHLQAFLSLATLVLIGVEEYLHLTLRHSL